MDGGRIIRDPLTRRGLLQGAGVALAGGTGVALLAACGDGDKTTTQSGGIEGRADDAGVLRRALAVELTMVDAYSRGTDLLRGPMREAGQAFLAQEQEHADVLTKAITQLGGDVTVKRLPVDYAQLRGSALVLDLWRRLEDLAIATYAAAIPKLSTGTLRATIGTISTCEAQHAAVILGALGRPQAPQAFVKGEPLDLR
jgi:hypothetical protein